MSPRALANQEREAQAKRLNQWVRSMLLSVATLLSMGTVGLLAADQLYRPDAFVIDQLKIKGKFNHLDPANIEQLISQQTLGNFFSIELSEIENQIESLPWVQDAEVRREWPNTLLVSVLEQQPVMRWGDDAWVNTRGEVVQLPFKPSSQDSVVLHGHERDSKLMLERSLQWRSILRQAGLNLRSMKLSESHAYQLELQEQDATQSFPLRLGRREVETRLYRFLELYTQQLDPQTQRLQRVDARYPDGVAIYATAIPTQDSEQESGNNDE